MNPIEIKREQLHALARFAGKGNVRPYLNGVCIETGPKGTFAVATDGHRLGAIQLNEDGPDETETCIIPIEDVARVPKKKPKGANVDPPLLFTRADRHGGNLEDPAHGLTLRVAFLDGKFPDWRLILPTKYNGQAGQFNPAYIKDFDMAAKDLGANAVPRIVVLHNGTDGAAVVLTHNHPEFLGVLMPVQGQVTPTCEWWGINEA